MHRCPISGCKATIPDHLLMCSTHWAQVPKPIQQAVYQGWNRQQKSIDAIPGYLKARSTAIRFVNQGGDQP